MIDGINDTPIDAMALADLLRGRRAHVNLIPMNPVAHTPWQPSSFERTELFATELRDAGIVDSEKAGLWAFYYVKPDALEVLDQWLS